MPKIDLTVSPGLLSAQARTTLPGQLAAALLKWEKAPDVAAMREVAWTHVHELDAQSVHDANGSTSLEHVLVDVTVPQGALSQHRRDGLTKEVTELVADATGLSDGALGRLWVLIHEVAEGNWGVGGTPVYFTAMREASRAAKEGKRTHDR